MAVIVELPDPTYAGKTSDQIIIDLLDSLGRLRCLTDGESRLLERVIRRSGSSRSAWRFWTDAEDTLLRKLARKGMTATKIAGVMDRTPDAIRSRFNTLKARPPKSRHRGLGRVGGRSEG